MREANELFASLRHLTHQTNCIDEIEFLKGNMQLRAMKAAADSNWNHCAATHVKLMRDLQDMDGLAAIKRAEDDAKAKAKARQRSERSRSASITPRDTPRANMSRSPRSRRLVCLVGLSGWVCLVGLSGWIVWLSVSCFGFAGVGVGVGIEKGVGGAILDLSLAAFVRCHICAFAFAVAVAVAFAVAFAFAFAFFSTWPPTTNLFIQLLILVYVCHANQLVHPNSN